MDPTLVLDRLGPGRWQLRVVTGSRGWLAAREDLAEELIARGLGPQDEPRLERIELIGKRPLEGLALGEVALVVRRYHHGGLLRWFTGERFGSPLRPFVELCLQRELERAGIRSPEVVAARAVRARPWGWRLAAVTRRVPDGLDLAQALAQQRAGRLTIACWRTLVAEVGRLVRRLHEIGFLHADLTPRNLLVERPALEAGQPRLWVLDLDRSRWVGQMGADLRRRNLQRLVRHFERLGRERGLELARTDMARFLRSYQEQRVARREIWRAIASGRRRTSVLHAAGWWLERAVGRGPSGAEEHLGPAVRRGEPPG